jgi:hypothetical protein
MSILKKIFGTGEREPAAHYEQARGLLIYGSVNDVIRAEGLLKKAGYEDIRVVAPPPQYRTGCDLSLEFPLVEQVGIARMLEQENAAPQDMINIVEELLRPTEICRVKDFGDYCMVRAANMKITYEKKSLIIVNVSGGGCSDVPYLAAEMIGKPLSEALSPREAGYTLCAIPLPSLLKRRGNWRVSHEPAACRHRSQHRP